MYHCYLHTTSLPSTGNIICSISASQYFIHMYLHTLHAFAGLSSSEPEMSLHLQGSAVDPALGTYSNAQIP